MRRKVLELHLRELTVGADLCQKGCTRRKWE